MGVFTGSSVIPVILSVTWTRCTRLGVLFGIVGGLLASVGTWVYLASKQDPGIEGIKNFIDSTCSLLV